METNPQKLKGIWDEGWALDLHTTSSMPMERDEQGNVTRWSSQHPPIAEALYQLKYCNDKSKVGAIAEAVAAFLEKKKAELQIDVILPVPLRTRKDPINPCTN